MHGRVPDGVAFKEPAATEGAAAEATAAVFDDEAVVFAMDERLTSMYQGMELDQDNKMQFRLTDFCFYTEKERYLCPLDFGLVEKDVPVFGCGVLKPIFDDDPTTWTWPTEKTGPVGLKPQPSP